MKPERVKSKDRARRMLNEECREMLRAIRDGHETLAYLCAREAYRCAREWTQLAGEPTLLADPER